MHEYFDDLVAFPSLESELEVEKKVRDLEKCQDIEEIRRYCMALVRENGRQTEFIANCLGKLAELQAVIVCNEYRVKQKPESWLSRLFSFRY